MSNGFKVTTETHEHDSGLKTLQQQLKIILEKKPYVMVGVLGSAGNHKDKAASHATEQKTVAMVAAVQEFGSEKRNIPERSFIRSTTTEQRGKFNSETTKIINHIIDGEKTVKQGLDLLGLSIQSSIKKKIKDISEPPLSPKTIAAKGSSKPLIDTAQMINSIQFESVVDGDQTKGDGEIDLSGGEG